eukprot:973993-Pelagomonas_calceolata.AAC.1
MAIEGIMFKIWKILAGKNFQQFNSPSPRGPPLVIWLELRLAQSRILGSKRQGSITRVEACSGACRSCWARRSALPTFTCTRFDEKVLANHFLCHSAGNVMTLTFHVTDDGALANRGNMESATLAHPEVLCAVLEDCAFHSG